MAKRKDRITEKENIASRSLDTLSTREILRLVNREDHGVAPAVAKQILQITRAVNLMVDALEEGGRIVYVGAGTSGRLGVLDAAECIPTFGTTRVIALMAGAPKAMFRPIEGMEDDPRAATRDLQKHKVTRKDIVVGISAGGDTTYTVAALKWARARRVRTVAVSANPRSAICRLADVAIAPRVGPEVVAGSTRMKAGTAQKMILNMLSTASMVRWGRVLGNRMVHMKLGSEKLLDRGRKILMRTTGAGAAAARRALDQSGQTLPVALIMLTEGVAKGEAEVRLAASSTKQILRAAASGGSKKRRLRRARRVSVS